GIQTLHIRGDRVSIHLARELWLQAGVAPQPARFVQRQRHRVYVPGAERPCRAGISRPLEDAIAEAPRPVRARTRILGTRAIDPNQPQRMTIHPNQQIPRAPPRTPPPTQTLPETPPAPPPRAPAAGDTARHAKAPSTDARSKRNLIPAGSIS